MTVTFSEAMNASTINNTNITLTTGGSNVTIAVTLSGNTATINPNADLNNSTQYTWTIGTGVQDTAGNALASSVSYTFTTVAPSCTLPSGSFEVVGGETAGQDWEGFVHVVDNSSQTGSMIQSFSVGTSSTVSCSDCQESALHSVRLRTPAELKSDNATLWNNLTTANGSHLIHFYADGRGHPDNLNYTPYSYRSELSFNRTDEKYTAGDERYYSMKFWAPSGVWGDNQSYATNSIIITQWKQYSGPPNFVVRLSNAADYKVYVKSHDDMGVSTTEIGTANPNAWNKLKYHMKFSEDSYGFFKIWLNGTQIYNYSGKTMHQTSKDGYTKIGMYSQIRRETHLLFDNVSIAPDLRCSTLSDWVAQ